MGASVADDMIRSYFERWQRLEEEKHTISDDLKELFAEAKGNGLDAKALRTVFREQVGDKAARDEFDAICDLYRASLTGPRARPAPARVEKIEEFDAETGEIMESAGKELPAEARQPSARPMESSATNVAGPPPMTVPGGEPGIPSTDAGGAKTEDHGSGLPGRSDEQSAYQSTKSEQAATISDAEVPAFLKKDRYVLRPHCLNPNLCAGSGSKHCHACLKARDEEIMAEGAAA